MPKAVKDIELTNLPDVIDLPSHDGAFLLLRYHGKPVGKIILPAKDGKLILADHSKEIEKEVEKHLKYAVIDHFLISDESSKIPDTPANIDI